MDRKEDIRKKGNQLMEPVFRNSVVELMAEYKDNEEENLKSIQNALQSLIDITVQMQKKGAKRPIRFLGLCYCNSSLLTGNYEMRLDLYDNDFYLDEEECCIYWCPAFITRYYERDALFFQKAIKQYFPRVRSYEIQQYLSGYYKNYIFVIKEFLCQKMPEVIRKVSWSDLLVEEKLEVLFGEYMGEGTFLPIKWDTAEVSRDEIF